MSSRIGTASALRIEPSNGDRQLEADRVLGETYTTIRRLTDTVGQLESRTAEARLVAQLLDRELTSLRFTFDPINALHSTHTWTGVAADLSRRRLDQYDDEHHTAIRLIQRVIDDLLHTATTTGAELESTSAELDVARRTAERLEIELGRFDDVAI